MSTISVQNAKAQVPEDQARQFVEVLEQLFPNAAYNDPAIQGIIHDFKRLYQNELPVFGVEFKHKGTLDIIEESKKRLSDVESQQAIKQLIEFYYHNVGKAI